MSYHNSRRGNRQSLRTTGKQPQPQQLGERRVGFIGYGRLRDWANLSDQPSELLTWMVSNIPEITIFLNENNIRDEHLDLFVTSLRIVLGVAVHEKNFTRLLETLATTKFYGHLKKFLFQNKSTTTAETILHLISETASLIPSCTEKCREILVFIINNQRAYGLKDNLISNTVVLFNAANQEATKKEKHQLKRWRDSDDPPDDIRDLSIYPSRQDLDDSVQPFLRANMVKGAYRNKSHYFDIIFRLMKEDFVGPLRKGIAAFQAGRESESDMIFYSNVRVVGLNVFNGIEHILLLDMKTLHRVRWDTEKRLMFGSLICLSDDNFKTLIYATVTLIDRDKLKQGILKVKFQNCLDKVYSFSSEDRFIMTENPSFFEAYRYVLEGLQEMVEKPLPMEKYLVQCKSRAAKPNYISESTIYDLSCLRKGRCKRQNHLVLRPNSWPDLTKLCLNKHQLQAVTTALTRELAVIQGPPGTGKTYVGLKIMQVLLVNVRGPVLVVCYTNHALDQFLEGILSFCKDGIVRVGGNRDSIDLREFNLKELRYQNTSQSLSTRNLIKDCHRKMDKIGARIRALANKMLLANLEIQNRRVLERHMTKSHFMQFPRDGDMKRWLCGSHTNLESHIRFAVEVHLISLIVEGQASREDTCLDFSRPIPRIMKLLVYRSWASEYEQHTGKKVKHCILTDEKLKPFVNHEVFKNIHRRFDTIKAWLLGTTLLEMLYAIKDIIKDTSASNLFDDNEDYKRILDLRAFGDEGSEEDDTMLMNSGLTSLLNQALHSGVDLTVESSGEDGVLSFGKTIKMVSRSVPESKMSEQKIMDVWQLNLDRRYRLYKLWLTRYLSTLRSEMRSLVDEYETVLQEKVEARNMQDVSILQQAKVIGMTTTGAAKHRHLLQAVSPPIVVAEEAAEVLEAHIVTALSGNCQHLILIGDHQQLKPKTEVYELARQFKLDVSLFERLVNNGVDHVQLRDQHRMRPEISEFSKLIYPHLTDNKSVFERPDIKGMVHNVFFINHNKPEKVVQNSRSKMNDYEANYLLRLCEYLIFQGYTGTEITILATYGGQASLIKEYIRTSGKNIFQDVRVSTVDNFQGEQNKIILLSLVRSNSQESVGFLSTDNRVCVALSRAQCGMYIIGNIDLLARHSSLWRKIKFKALERHCIGNSLQIECQEHGRVTEIEQVQDFDHVRTRGCGHKCKSKLKCGHRCPYLCHRIDHSQLKCKEPCRKVCLAGHECPARCFESCPPCEERVKVRYRHPCGHSIHVLCYKDLSFLQEKGCKVCARDF